MTTLLFDELDFVVVVAPNGYFRYGCISKVEDDGWQIAVSLHDEGYNKIHYDALCGGYKAEDWKQELTPVEQKIVPLLAQGYSTKEIAKEMTISEVTARGYIRLLRIKLNLENRDQLIAFAQGLSTILGGNGNGEHGEQQGTPGQNQSREKR